MFFSVCMKLKIFSGKNSMSVYCLSADIFCRPSCRFFVNVVGLLLFFIYLTLAMYICLFCVFFHSAFMVSANVNPIRLWCKS